MKLGSSMASLVLLGTACSVVPDPTYSTGESERVSERADGLHRPAAEPVGSPCGPSRCKDGQFCCNESCGICAPRGGICLQRECGPASSVLTECTDDSGCRAISSYCDGCQCLAAGTLDPEPSCHAAMVYCILDPCHHQHPACVNGVCAIMDD